MEVGTRRPGDHDRFGVEGGRAAADGAPQQIRTGLGPCRLDEFCLLLVLFGKTTWNSISRSGIRAGRDDAKGERPQWQRLQPGAYQRRQDAPDTGFCSTMEGEFEEDRRPASRHKCRNADGFEASSLTGPSTHPRSLALLYLASIQHSVSACAHHISGASVCFEKGGWTVGDGMGVCCMCCVITGTCRRERPAARRRTV